MPAADLIPSLDNLLAQLSGRSLPEPGAFGRAVDGLAATISASGASANENERGILATVLAPRVRLALCE